MLEPGEVDAIARAVIAMIAPIVFWGGVATAAFSVTWSVLFGIGVLAPRAGKVAFKKYEKAALDPESEISKVAKAREDALAKRFEDKLAALKLPEAPDLSKLAIQIDTSTMEAAMENVLNKHKMAGVRASRGDPQEQDLAIAQNANANPDGAKLLSDALRGVDMLVNQKLIKAATGKDWAKQLKEQFAATGDITDLLKSFGFGNILQGGGGGGGSGSSASHY